MLLVRPTVIPVLAPSLGTVKQESLFWSSWEEVCNSSSGTWPESLMKRLVRGAGGWNP